MSDPQKKNRTQKTFYLFNSLCPPGSCVCLVTQCCSPGNACSNHISFPVSITDSYSSTVGNCFVGNYPFTCYQIITYMYILPHHVQSWFVFYEAIFCFVTYISFCSQWNSFEIAAIWWPSLLHLACYICFVTFNSSNCFICLWGLK